MATLCRYLLDWYEDTLVKKADPRVAHLPFVSPNYLIFGIILFYINFANKWGPAWMKSREPFVLNKLMIVYNILQIIVNSYLFITCYRIINVQEKFSLICQEVDYADEPIPQFIAQTVWLYFVVKILDMADTVFMVLRKKEKQISFLHVFHHAGMVFAGWVATKYVAGGHVIMVGLVNSFVHAVMYIYYLLTAINPEYKKSIWWKKHLTELQMVQFLYLAWHSAVVVFNPYCKFPRILMVILFPENLFMLLLFWDFYKKNYLTKKEIQSEKLH